MAANTLQTVAAGTTVSPTGTRDPSQTSSEYKKMAPKWELITDVMEGVEQVRTKPHYLPKFSGETQSEYDRRRNTSPWRPEFEDCVRGLAAKPFSKDVGLKTPTDTRFTDLAEDIDGRGNSLTAFSRAAFAKGIAKGLHAILVDYPDMHAGQELDTPRPLTIQQERDAGVRPYWLHVEADNILALYTKWVAGKEIIEHIRIREDFVTRDGFSEVTGTRIRVYEPGLWEVWEKKSKDSAFVQTAGGPISRGGKHTSIPVVLFFTGDREGEMLVKPPLLDLAHMQIELYRAQSRQEEVMTFASSPMLTANGMKKPGAEEGPVVVGPKTVLFAGAVGASWDYINPDAKNVKEVRTQVGEVQNDMRRLGMQPLVQRTGRAVATSDSIEAARAHSAVQAWAIDLKDVLEQCFVFTGEWLGLDKPPEVSVYTDFSAIPSSKTPLDSLANARAVGDLSRDTYWQGLQRFDILPPDFDAKAEKVLLAEEEKLRPKPPSVPKRDPITGEAVPAPTPTNPAPTA